MPQFSTIQGTLSAISTRATRIWRDFEDLMSYNTESVARYAQHAGRDDPLAEQKLEMRIKLSNHSKHSILKQKQHLHTDLADTKRQITAFRGSDDHKNILAGKLLVVETEVADMEIKMTGYFSVEIFAPDPDFDGK